MLVSFSTHGQKKVMFKDITRTFSCSTRKVLVLQQILCQAAIATIMDGTAELGTQCTVTTL